MRRPRCSLDVDTIHNAVPVDSRTSWSRATKDLLDAKCSDKDGENRQRGYEQYDGECRSERPIEKVDLLLDKDCDHEVLGPADKCRCNEEAEGEHEDEKTSRRDSR